MQEKINVMSKHGEKLQEIHFSCYYHFAYVIGSV